MLCPKVSQYFPGDNSQLSGFYKDIKSSRYGNILISGVFLGAWHITVCIAEVRIFDAGSARNCSKIEKQKNKKRTNVDRCSSARTTDGERSNAHCFSIQPVFWQYFCYGQAWIGLNLYTYETQLLSNSIRLDL